MDTPFTFQVPAAVPAAVGSACFLPYPRNALPTTNPWGMDGARAPPPHNRCAAPVGVAPRVSSSSWAFTDRPWRSYVRCCWSRIVRSASAAAS